MNKEDKKWHKRFRAMKRGMGLQNADIAKITGNTADSVRVTTNPKSPLPRWTKLSIFIYEELSKK